MVAQKGVHSQRAIAVCPVRLIVCIAFVCFYFLSCRKPGEVGGVSEMWARFLFRWMLPVLAMHCRLYSLTSLTY